MAEEEKKSWRERISAGEGLLDDNEYKCERCGRQARFEMTKLCGGCLTAKLCRACIRDSELDRKQRNLIHDLHRARIRSSAFIRGGDANMAGFAFEEEIKAEDALFRYTIEWLKPIDRPPIERKKPEPTTLPGPGRQG